MVSGFSAAKLKNPRDFFSASWEAFEVDSGELSAAPMLSIGGVLRDKLSCIDLYAEIHPPVFFTDRKVDIKGL